jgi:hypothetical protein
MFGYDYFNVGPNFDLNAVIQEEPMNPGNGNGNDNTVPDGCDGSKQDYKTPKEVKAAYIDGCITYGWAQSYIVNEFGWSDNDVNDLLYIEDNYTYTHPGISQTDSTTSYLPATPKSSWTILTTNSPTGTRWSATSRLTILPPIRNWPDANYSSPQTNQQFYSDTLSAKDGAIVYINGKITAMHNNQTPIIVDSENGNGGGGMPPGKPDIGLDPIPEIDEDSSGYIEQPKGENGGGTSHLICGKKNRTVKNWFPYGDCGGCLNGYAEDMNGNCIAVSEEQGQIYIPQSTPNLTPIKLVIVTVGVLGIAMLWKNKK